MTDYISNPCVYCNKRIFSSVNQGKHEVCRSCGLYRK